MLEGDKASFIATIEESRGIPAGNRNLFEVTFLSNNKTVPQEGQLLVTEANYALREDSSVFVRNALSTVKNGKILAEVLNLGQSAIKNTCTRTICKTCIERL